MGGQFGLQDANSPIIEELIFLHDFINIILIFIITFVGFIIVRILFNSFINKNLLERQIIECIWTIIPAIILIQIAIPSLLLLYILDESIDSNLITIFQGVYVSEEIIFLPFINLIFIISVSILFFNFFVCVTCGDKDCPGCVEGRGEGAREVKDLTSKK